MWRRFGAFLLDFTTIMMVAVPIGAMPMLVAEYYYTGSFEWSFEREFVNTDRRTRDHAHCTSASSG